MPTIAELKAALKAKGIKGYSGKNKAALEAMLPKSGGTSADMLEAAIPKLKAALEAAMKPSVAKVIKAAKPIAPHATPVAVTALAKAPVRKPIVFTTPGPSPELEHLTLDRPRKAKKPITFVPNPDIELSHPTLDRPGKAKKPTKREFEEEYAAYVRDQERRGGAAKEMRRLISEKSKNIMNQGARFLNAAHIEGIDDDYTPEPYEVFHTKKMEEIARKAAAEAEKPSRYKALLAEAMKKIEKKNAAVSKGPGKDEHAFEIPPSATLKVLQNLARDKGIKGFSGKSAGDLRELIVKEIDARAERHKLFHEQRFTSASRDAAHIKFLVEAHNMSESELKRRLALQEKKKDEAEEHIRIRSREIKNDHRSKKITLEQANAQVQALNVETRKFEEDNKAIHMILLDAIRFKETGKSQLLERAHDSVDVFYF